MDNTITPMERAFYEAGKKTSANKDFWNANSEFETTATPDRDTIRARARWVSENDPIMNNIDLSIINNVCGNGIHFQSMVKLKSFNKVVEERFKMWATNKQKCDVSGRLNFYEIQRLALKTRMVDGEVFIYKIYTKNGLQLQIIEADNLDTSKGNNGLEINRYGKVTKYHFLDANLAPYSIDARYIINYYMPVRPSQYRGISEYKQAILSIKNFSAYQLATVQSARARANIAYYVKQENGGKTLNADEEKRTQSINGVSVIYLNKGETINKLDPDSAPTDFTKFSETMIRQIATSRNISYELAYKDYSKVNFASSRASILQDFKRFDHEQQHLVDNVLQNVYEAWLENEILNGSIKASNYYSNQDMYHKTKWIMPKRDLVDPLKEILAIEKLIKLNLTTATDEANARGDDFEEILAKKQKEQELIEKYGIIQEDVAGGGNINLKKDGSPAKEGGKNA